VVGAVPTIAIPAMEPDFDGRFWADGIV